MLNEQADFSVNSCSTGDFVTQQGFDAKENEILGSGNFEVIKGGTFYDADTYYNARGNTRPKQHYGGDFFENFRDFQDIKSDLYNRPERYY